MCSATHASGRLCRWQRKRVQFSFRAYLVDLILLLQESMMGTAATACFVCLSQAPANLMQSKFALDFGETFAQLHTAPRPTRPQPRAKLVSAAEALLFEATGALRGAPKNSRTRPVREAQRRDCEQQLEIYKRYGGRGGGGKDGGGGA